MILLLTIPHEQESRFDTDRPYKERNEVNMIHLGDITKIHGNEIEPVDCITFGSPCQDLSIAGRRAGLAGERSGLFMEAVRIIKEMRSSTNGLHPTFAIWENVPGAFSSNNGEDFRAVLEELARIGQADAVVPGPPRGGRWSKAGAIAGNGWSLAWRQLDSQYFGVAQRRKRIALILDLRGQRAGEILFERTSLSRHPDPCIQAWKEVAGLTANCPVRDDRVVGERSFCITEFANYAVDGLETVAAMPVPAVSDDQSKVVQTVNTGIGKVVSGAQTVLANENAQKVIQFIRGADIEKAQLEYDANPDNYDLSNVDFFPTVYGSGVSEQDLSALADLQNYRQNIVELPSIGGSDNDTGGNSGGFGGGGSTSFQRTYTSSSGNTYVYSPNFVIYGGMTAEELHSILADDYQRFCENMEQYEREMRRKNYGT